MSDPSTYSHLNKLRIAAWPTGGVIPTGALTSPVELPGFIEGSFGGVTYTEVDDTAQDSPDAFEEKYDGHGQPITITGTFRFNKANITAFIALLPTGPPLPPSMNRMLLEGEMPNGVKVRTIARVNMTEIANAPLKDKMTTQLEFRGSGKPVFIVPV